jgi:hypothetical protein
VSKPISSSKAFVFSEWLKRNVKVTGLQLHQAIAQFGCIAYTTTPDGVVLEFEDKSKFSSNEHRIRQLYKPKETSNVPATPKAPVPPSSPAGVASDTAKG